MSLAFSPLDTFYLHAALWCTIRKHDSVRLKLIHGTLLSLCSHGLITMEFDRNPWVLFALLYLWDGNQGYMKHSHSVQWCRV